MPEIDVYSEEFTSANILQAEAGTNCPQGGDSGHGGRTILRLIDQEAQTSESRLMVNKFVSMTQSKSF